MEMAVAHVLVSRHEVGGGGDVPTQGLVFKEVAIAAAAWRRAGGARG
mgnify:CR=1 FL=1